MAEECRRGECEPIGSMMPDAGPGAGDAGTGMTDGGGGPDGGVARVDAGTVRDSDDGGCGCTVPGARGGAGGAWLLLILPIALLFRRLRGQK
jgi:hypothetical protein